MFFLFTPPCTKNAKSNLATFIKIKESWNLIKHRLKGKISGNEMIEMGACDGKKRSYFDEKRVNSVSKNGVNAETELGTSKKLQKSGKHSVNILQTYRAGGKHKFKAQKLGNNTFRLKKGKTNFKPEKADLDPLAVHRITAQYHRVKR